ncbi:DUF4279 domain-containing protein [Helicobacter fennelliae]|uniref:Uncharacterized protein n=2 Tax=Helicobacter fennelliae TaxID=215 RepID=T1CZF0_9HELI|nr:DUF4279 domain-containing protein [Helicobacter fennelliae]GAD19315.1 hypothetical protein HFN_0446 [Helicobacter fennelliae MRY12-0050]SQB99089.1 Uncharacterised protein [Helicobacter fennelliae]STP08366.1 Uncharacterised protein [Helicobacter fennelliae]STQ84779.1 Uncharacterised protein [Helicobacter fennelliae]
MEDYEKSTACHSLAPKIQNKAQSSAQTYGLDSSSLDSTFLDSSVLDSHHAISHTTSQQNTQITQTTQTTNIAYNEAPLNPINKELLSNKELPNKELPHSFYKISSKILHSDDFRKECDRFIDKLEKKQKIILALKEKHNAFLVFRIYSMLNKKHHTRSISLSKSVGFAQSSMRESQMRLRFLRGRFC